MTQVAMPYRKSGKWFVRVPCYIRAELVGGQLHLTTRSCVTDRPVGFVVISGHENKLANLVSFLDRVWADRDQPDADGVGSRNGKYSLVAYGLYVGGWHEGGMALDVHVPGGCIRVEPG